MPIHDQVTAVRRRQGANRFRLDGHRASRAPHLLRQAGVSRPAPRILASVLRARRPDLRRNESAQAQFLAPTAETFRQFLDQQEIFVFFLTVYVGAGLIANDRRANALQIYLSKPLTRAEYVFGKLAILMTFLLFVTWLPAILLLIVQIVFAGNFTFFRNNAFLFPAITVFCALEVVVVSTAMLALSSLSKSSRYVGILYAAVIFFSSAMYGVLTAVTRNSALSWISFSASLAQVGNVIFRQPLKYDTPWPVSLLVSSECCAVRGRPRTAGPRGRGRRVTSVPVSAEHLSKWYGQVIGLNDVSVTVPAGITGLLGPNGAGKSTFMKLVTGQLKPSKGGITVLGEPIWQNPALYTRIGFCPEQGRVLRPHDRPGVGDGAREAQRHERKRSRSDGAPQSRDGRADRRRQQENRRLQQGHASAREDGAGDRARSRVADSRRAAVRHGSESRAARRSA